MNPFEFSKQLQLDVRKNGLVKKTVTLASDYNRFVTEAELIAATKSQYETGHFRESVLNAYICVNNLVKSSIGSGKDGSSLMKEAFSANSPVLKINDFTTQSEKDEQLGYMEIFSGCMTGIRNPRAHETDWPDDKQKALVLLIWANHLIRRIKASTKTA